MLNLPPEQADNDVLGEKQALKYAKEFSVLYRAEKQKRRELEQAHSALKAYAEELERKNSDLRDFSFIASHYLQEPLRKIVAFGGLVEQKASNLDGQSKDYLERMQKSAMRMQQFIKDLHQLSQVEIREKSYQPVKVEEIISEILDDLEETLLQSGGKVVVNAMPVLEGDRFQIKQLFLNLILNALKFHKPGQPPAVALNSRFLPDGFWEIAVEDNGIGIDKKYLDRIFKPFERLHSQAEFSGTGMGLAISKKIALRHGGKIIAKSEPGKGTTFVVTFPEKQSIEIAGKSDS